MAKTKCKCPRCLDVVPLEPEEMDGDDVTCPNCGNEFAVCRTCGDGYDGCGDGYDGECPDCADKSERRRRRRKE